MRLTTITCLGLISTIALGCSSSSNTATTDAGTAGADGTTRSLYQRLGGHDGINAALGKVVTAELANPTIAAYFSNVGKAGHPSADQLIECLTIQLSQAAGGTEMYQPRTSMGKGFTCRSMPEAHAGLAIKSEDFDTFVSIAGMSLSDQGVAAADITTIAGVLTSVKGDVVGK